MIARWDSKCSLCLKPVKAGDDVHYDSEAKQVSHWPCRENPVPTPADFSKASELGFVPSADIGSVSWVAVCADWVLRNMLSAPVRETAGRERPVPRGRNGDLWGEES